MQPTLYCSRIPSATASGCWQGSPSFGCIGEGAPLCGQQEWSERPVLDEGDGVFECSEQDTAHCALMTEAVIAASAKKCPSSLNISTYSTINGSGSLSRTSEI